MTPKKLFFVAAGKVGQALGKRLLDHGHTGLGVWGRHEAQAKQAAALLQIPAYWGQPFPEALSAAEVVLVTPPERAVMSLGAAIAPFLADGAVVLHTAGSLPPLLGLGVGRHGGVLHPLQSIATPNDGAALEGAFMAVAGDAEALLVATGLAQDAEGKPVQVTDPVLYHLGAVMASNTLYPLFAAACELLVRAGVSAETAPQMLLPLLRGSIENLARFGPVRGMTGPIARADAETVARHLQALAHEPELREIYVPLARRAVLLAEEAGAEPRGLRAIEALLAE